MRESIAKSIRFEVFKRDNFSCQYCGAKAPDVLLHVDHIEPVSKGGSNEILNLITSCESCNLGKSATRLTDNSALDKQRKQIELLQERREQIELMFEWKKSLSNLDDETLNMIKDYTYAKIKPFTFNANGENVIKPLLKKYGIIELLNAIDISANTYLKHSMDGQLIHESVENFINKLGGILYNQSLKPIDKKLSLIKNKAKNRFNYYDPQKAAIALNQYVAALRNDWNYTDEQIIKDIESELTIKLDESRNWSDWKGLLDDWTESIRSKKENTSPLQEPPDKPDRDFKGDVIGRLVEMDETLLVLYHLLSPFPNFNRQNFEIIFKRQLLNFMKAQANLLLEERLTYSKDEEALQMYIYDFIEDAELSFFWAYDHSSEILNENTEGQEKSNLLVALTNVIYRTIERLFQDYFFISPTLFSPLDTLMLINKLSERI